MYKAAKIGMIGWTSLSLLGVLGLINVANTTNGNMSDSQAVGMAVGIFAGLLFWFFPFVGMGILALATRPKPVSPTPHSATPHSR
jgi:hypothetical protein